MIFCYKILYPKCTVQSSGEKILLIVNSGWHRDPQLDNLQRVRGFGTISSKCYFFMQKKRWKDCKSQRLSRKTVFQHNRIDAYIKAETETACKGSIQSSNQIKSQHMQVEVDTKLYHFTRCDL